MKKKDEIILEIADVNFPNKAYGYYEGEKVIVKNAVPGQKVQAQVFKKRGSGVEARLQEVIERSPMESVTAQSGKRDLMAPTMRTIRSSVNQPSSPPWRTNVRKPRAYPALQQERICSSPRR